MQHEERLVAFATVGLIIAAVGAFLPWARVGGRSRSGFSTADTFIRLSNGALPDQLAWVGQWWYVPAVLAVAAWASVVLRGSALTRVAGVVASVAGLAMWWLFVWAANNYNVLDVRLTGPIIASIGIVAIGACCSQKRLSLLRPSASIASE